MIRLFPARFNKYWILLLGSLLVIVAVYLYINIFRGTTMSPDMIHIRSSEMTDGSLIVNGSSVSSGNAFKGYSYKVQDGNMILKVRYVLLVSRWYPTGDFQIQFTKQDLVGVHEVYLYEDDKNKRLLWSQNE